MSIKEPKSTTEEPTTTVAAPEPEATEVKLETIDPNGCKDCPDHGGGFGSG